jgi:hypothetical protein
MWRLLTGFIIICCINLVYSQENHQLFTEILQQYVHDGRVDYKNLKEDKRLDDYIKKLSIANPDTIENKNDRFAFWINAYNAYTLKVVCDNYPVKSIKDLSTGTSVLANLLNTTVWDRELVIINHQKMTLNHVEHDIIRPIFNDPRAHFALVCAAISCPPLRSVAYEGFKLDNQLSDQGRVFFNYPDQNYFLLDKKEAHLSKIMDWYSKDFGKTDEDVLLYLTKFLPDKIANAIRSNPGDWKIEYNEYDWSLNE